MVRSGAEVLIGLFCFAFLLTFFFLLLELGSARPDLKRQTPEKGAFLVLA